MNTPLLDEIRKVALRNSRVLADSVADEVEKSRYLPMSAALGGGITGMVADGPLAGIAGGAIAGSLGSPLMIVPGFIAGEAIGGAAGALIAYHASKRALANTQDKRIQEELESRGVREGHIRAIIEEARKKPEGYRKSFRLTPPETSFQLLREDEPTEEYRNRMRQYIRSLRGEGV